MSLASGAPRLRLVPLSAPGSVRRSTLGQLTRLLVFVDAAAIAVAVVVSQQFGSRVLAPSVQPVHATFALVTIGLIWLWVLRALGSTKHSVLGAGVTEYQRVVQGGFIIVGGTAAIEYIVDSTHMRATVLLGIPAGTVLLLLGRRAVRARISRIRRDGGLLRTVMLIGSPCSVQHLQNTFLRSPESGFRPVAAVFPSSDATDLDTSLVVPVLGSERDVGGIVEHAERCGADVVAISIGASLDPVTVQQLGWELRDREISMILAPSLTEVAGPRIHMHPIDGLPLIHVSTPRLGGVKAFVKRCADLIGACVGLVVLAPALALLAVIVKLESPGPALFHQERVGKDGVPFRIHKFRSMYTGAELEVAALMEEHGGASPFFKLKDDPRVTRLGSFLRRYSLDELPQLWNVLRGEMSLVGPRPQVKAEVETYGKYDHRRLMVKPGVTGPWQVSGRNDLSPEDGVALDLYYVENWSLMLDTVLLVRTVRAVLQRTGAY